MATAPTSSPSKFVKDLTGQKFGRLTVLRYLRVNDNNNAIWLCECSCVKGKICEAIGSNLTRGSKVSCGCYHDESAATRRKTHGMSKSPEFRAWSGMLARTGNKNLARYSDWGGRGITVCEEWRESFEKFYEDMGPRPSPDHSLERLDNNLGYCKENCVWTTAKAQARNRRNNRWIEYNGESFLIQDLAAKFGMSFVTLRYRLNAGWPLEKALKTPVHEYTKPLARKKRTKKAPTS